MMRSFGAARAALIVTATLTTAVVLAGCSSSHVDAGNLPQKNIQLWVMPLDQYQQSDGNAAEYAELLLDKPCMEAAGYSWPVPYRDTTVSSATFNTVGRRLFTKQIAATYGYHLNRPTLANSADWAQFNAMTGSIQGQEFSKLRSCQAEARKVVPIVDDETNYTSTLGNAAIEAADRDPAVKVAAAKWRKCMVPVGVSDLPRTPEEMPSHSQSQLYSLADSSSVPGPAEEKAASADYDCRVSSGWRTAAYNAEWSENVKVIGENHDQLDRNKAIIDSSAAKVAKTIAANAPAK